MKFNNVGFPTPYASNEEKNTEEYGAKVFKAIMDSTSAFRNKVLKSKAEARKYALGKQSLKKYLDELGIEGTKQYINISYTPTRILQKFEKVVVDDYQQLKEKLKVEALSSHIKIRKEKKKSDLKFNYEYKDFLQGLEQEIGIGLTGEEGYPEDKEELDLMLTISPDEREEVLMKSLVDKTFEDNDLESLKRLFLSEIFQVAFAGFHLYEDKIGRKKIEFVPIERAIFGQSYKEILDDSPYHGREVVKTIAEIREMFNITSEKEEKLYKLARQHQSILGNGTINYGYDYKFSEDYNRPYDDFNVKIYHIWYKSLETIEYIEGETSTGRALFAIETNGRETKRKRKGVSAPQVAFEGWFTGYPDDIMVLKWGKATNMLREGDDYEKLVSPYIFFIPDNRGDMDTDSAVQLVIPDIETMDLMGLQIKKTLANHPPSGYAIDHEALMDVDLGVGDLSPLDVEDIYRQTGTLYHRRRDSEGLEVAGSSPITPIIIPMQDTINTYINTYNLALNSLRSTLGINENREGTADLRRVSNAIAQSQFSVSQTATYYIYRSYLKSASKLAKIVGISLWNSLKWGSADKGTLYYIGKENSDFIKERDSITSTQYKYSIDPQMSQEDRERLDVLVQQCLSSGQLEPQDALLILSLEDIKIAEKYLRYYINKSKKEALRLEDERQRLQSEYQGDMAVRAEEAKRETFQIQSSLQAQEWEIKGKNEKDVKAFELAMKLIQGEQEGKQIPDMYRGFVELSLQNYMLKQEKSMTDTEREIENEETQLQEQQAVESVQQAVSSGDMTEEEGAEILNNLGIM